MHILGIHPKFESLPPPSPPLPLFGTQIQYFPFWKKVQNLHFLLMVSLKNHFCRYCICICRDAIYKNYTLEHYPLMLFEPSKIGTRWLHWGQLPSYPYLGHFRGIFENFRQVLKFSKFLVINLRNTNARIYSSFYNERWKKH